MKLAVCVKYVPVVAHIRFDPTTKTMLREGVPSEINPFDRLGVTCAIALKADPADQVLAISMGPPQAKDGLVVFHLPPDSPKVTTDDVRRIEAEGV